MNYFILTILLLILGFLLLYILKKYYNIESFEVYNYGPYNYMTTGASPLAFYRYPIYRQPYMYPYQFYSSYPYPHMNYHETNI